MTAGDSRRRRESLFDDRATIEVRGGRGGEDSGLSFRREKYVPKGGPDGGDGGRGGDVVVVADPRLRDLSTLRSRRRFADGRGGSGRGGRRHGEGDDVEIEFPVAQVVDANETALLADLTRPGARAVVARGGAAAAGTPTSTRHARRRASPRPACRARSATSSCSSS